MKNQSIPSIDEIECIAEEAYIYAYPLLENYKTMDRTVGPGADIRQAFNTLKSNSKLLGPEFTKIVAPNNDTVYSSTWLDLADEPLVLSVPDIPDHRYWVFQMVNMYNFNFGYVGARTTGYEHADFLICGPDWTGDTPVGVKKSFRSETRFAFLIGRTLIDGPEDVENVKVIQGGYRLQSLSAYQGTVSGKSGQALPELLPYKAEDAQSAKFIAYFNLILKYAAIHPDDETRFKRFSRIGIGPGLPFSESGLTEETINAVNRGVNSAMDKIDKKVKEIGRKVNGWNTLVDSHGPREVLGEKPLVNAAGAKAALYGNDKEEASNYVGFFDSKGRELDTLRYSYTLRFEKDQFPPVNAFWSITMYRLPEILLVPNPINRYAIGDRTRDLKYNDDGSLEIYIQKQSPGPDRESNWLPGPSGPFIIALRNYWPDQSRFADFKPPAIERIGRSHC